MPIKGSTLFTVKPDFSMEVRQGTDDLDQAVRVEVREDGYVYRIVDMAGNECRTEMWMHVKAYGYFCYIYTFGTYEIFSKGETRILKFTRESTTLEEVKV